MAAELPERDPAVVSRFIERFAQVFVEAGMPRIASRIFIALVATDSGRLTAAELAGQLRASPAAISSGVRYLIQVNLVSREREPGSRRDHYRVDDDVWYQSMLASARSNAQLAETARQGVSILGPGTPAATRLEGIARFVDFVGESIIRAAEQAREILYTTAATPPDPDRG